MKIDVFREFCSEVIEKYINEILESDKDLKCLTLRKHNIDKIYIYYERKRIEVKKTYMQDPKKPLDRHKIASCMIYAILKSKVFKVNRLISNIPEKLLLSNEYLAFYVAINIVEMFKRAEEEYEFSKDYVLFFPKVYHINSQYEEGTFAYNTCKGMSFIKNIKYFDILAYSTILFQMESNTDTILSYDKKLKNKEISA